MKETMLESELRKLGTPANLKDKIYQKTLLKYEAKKKTWKGSDTLVFKFWIYVAPTWIGYLIFAGIFTWFFIRLYESYGYSRMIAFIAILMLWRINILISQMRELNKRLS